MHANTAIPRSVWTSDDGSMAQETAKFRWPKLVEGMIHDVRAAGSELVTSRAYDEITLIERSLGRLKKEINDDAPLW